MDADKHDPVEIEARRLQYLKEMAAFKGIDTPPHIHMEIEDIEKRIADRADKELSQPGIPRLPRPYFAHPYPLQSNFTGRITERQMLTNWLISDERSILTLTAMGGMGKSALTWYWIQKDASSVALDGILWWSFYEGESSFSKFIDEALTYISDQKRNTNRHSSNYEKVRILFNLLQQNRVLIILDGFERQLRAYANINAAYQQDTVTSETTDARSCIDPNASRFLRDLVAGPTQAKILITTRLMVRDLEDSGGDPLASCRQEKLDSLAPNDAIVFMHAQGVTKGTNAEISAVCKSYGFHPLSLRLLSGLIARDKRKPGDIATAPLHDVHADITTHQHHVLEGAYNALSDNLRVLLSRMAAFRNPMDYDALMVINEFASESDFDKALDELLERGLVFFDKQHKRYDLHPIVRSYSYDRLSDPQGIHSRLRNYFESLPSARADQVQTIDDIETVIELYHHTVQTGLLDIAARLFESRLRDILYFKLAAYPKYVELCMGFLHAAQSNLDVKASDILRIKNRLAVAHQKMGLLRLSLDGLRHVNQESFEKSDTNLHYRTLSNIAQIERDLGELRRSKDDFNQAIALAKEFGDSLEVGRALQELGLTEIITGEYKLAIANLVESNKVQYAPEHNRTFAYLALAYLYQGMPQKAYNALEQANKLAMGYTRNQVWVYWIRGMYFLSKNKFLECDSHLSEAITYCRGINLVELEADILLEFARLRFAQAQQSLDQPYDRSLLHESLNNASEALSIAERCEYRLKQASIHNFLAKLEIAAGNVTGAQKRARQAKELALCDGIPFHYKHALNESERLLQAVSTSL